MEQLSQVGKVAAAVAPSSDSMVATLVNSGGATLKCKRLPRPTSFSQMQATVKEAFNCTVAEIFCKSIEACLCDVNQGYSHDHYMNNLFHSCCYYCGYNCHHGWIQLLPTPHLVPTHC